MKTRIVKLKFKAPVHFGGGRLSDSGYACDASTLFSALFIEALRTGEADRLLEATRKGKFLISDAFPYIGDTLYLPKPMVPPAAASEKRAQPTAEDSRVRKASKKLEYIPRQSYQAYLEGAFDPIAELENFNLGRSMLHTKVNLEREESGDAKPFHVGSYYYEPGAGLYFLAQTDGFDFEPLLEQLSYSGIGGKRTSGYGRFDFVVDEADASTEGLFADTSHDTVDKDACYVLLSTASPAKDELTEDLLSGSRYRLVRKGGFVQSTTYSETLQKKRELYMFAAGSVFSQRFCGDVFDVSGPQGMHPVYKYGRAMWMEL